MNTLRINARDSAQMQLAADILRLGGLCAMPTETVYGLAANALSGEAVSKIFIAKGRPQDNPLIVHIADISELSKLWASVPECALKLAAAFWPGPLTMIYTRSKAVPDEVTAGLDTVGVRMPSHPAARELIEKSGVPLAAPSANLSGKPSPTTFRHTVLDMDGRIDAAVDGGNCSVGVESTVVDITGEEPRILRPGAITEEMIAAVLGAAETDPAVECGLKDGEKPRSPGMKYRHYAPNSKVILLCGAPDRSASYALSLDRAAAMLCFDEYESTLSDFSRLRTLGRTFDHEEHSRLIFTALRELDGAPEIYVQCPSACGRGAAVVNRLRRAAGFCSIACSKTVIGVTGRSGSGKSRIASMLAEELSLPLFDADACYKKMLSENGEMTAAVRKAFPQAWEGDKIDRSVLGALVFRDPAAKALLESVTHPFVKAEAYKASKNGAILDVPLLFESTIDRLCSATLGILCPQSLSLQRICARDGISEERALLRLSAQPPEDFYKARCDLTVINDGRELSSLAKKLIK